MTNVTLPRILGARGRGIAGPVTHPFIRVEDFVVPNSQISRRRIVQGAAWAAPAILVATAAPAAACASTEPKPCAPPAPITHEPAGPNHVKFTIPALATMSGVQISAPAAFALPTLAGAWPNPQWTRVGDDTYLWQGAEQDVEFMVTAGGENQATYPVSIAVFGPDGAPRGSATETMTLTPASA
ncbi:hypothetical protein [Demequina pelophila]|uniref:hypothetical protein n=1 Tax=Demequina pelophila TaxID=1638984 RepID=UPI00078182D5|nr:hypothetical protein [Demequina pelophila]